MACVPNVLSGIAMDCGSNGGIKKLYIAHTSDVASIAVDADGEITGLTMATGSTSLFKSYSFRKNNASYTETGTRNEQMGNYYSAVEITLQFNKMDKEKRSEIVKLLASQVYVIVKDYNDVYHFIGKDSYCYANSTGQTGAALADGNFYSLTISSELPEPICTVSTSVMETAGVVNAAIVG